MVQRTVILGLILFIAASLDASGAYRKRIVIDHSSVFATNQERFPVFVTLQSPELKSTAHGGHVNSNNGDDIYFTLDSGSSILPHDLVMYKADTGELQAWVTLPLLSCTVDTGLYLNYGGVSKAVKSGIRVWDESYVLVRHLRSSRDPGIEIPHSPDFDTSDQITVEAWVYSDSYRPEVIQPLVSKWSPLTSFDSFVAYDASKTDGLQCLGYLGAVFDGRFVYFSPMVSEQGKAHGHVLRYDTHGDFTDRGSYAAYDAGNTAGLETKGYYGAVFDGRYVYFVPRKDFIENHSRVLRYDTSMDFNNPRSWDACDVGEAHTQQGAAFDGRYIYFSPGYKGDPNAENEYSGRVIRFDTRAPFKDRSSWVSYDAGAVSGLQTVCFDGAAFDGRYVYFAPLLYGAVLRYDTRADFTAETSWSAFDAKQISMGMCVGTVFDGRYLYFVPYYNSIVVRFDTRGDFFDVSSWQSRDVGGTGGLNTGGFDGGFFDGRFVYFVPFVSPGTAEKGVLHRNKKYIFHANFLRYDTVGEFDDPRSWASVDAGKTDSLETIGYNAGAFDGRFFYLAPWRNGNDGTPGIYGRIQRYDTVGTQGSFSLRYGDYGSNGGLCAAVRGPSFIVNTVKGPVSVSGHEALLPGWHHIAGTYNGRTTKLYVDGSLVDERAGTGAIQPNDVSMVIGSLLNNSARFSGTIDEVRISRVARSDDWIRTEYVNLARPSTCIAVGKEETVR